MSKPPSNAVQIPLYAVSIPTPGQAEQQQAPTQAKPVPDAEPDGLCYECGEAGKYTLTVTSKFHIKRTICGKCMGYYATQAKYAKWSKSQYQKNG